MADARRPTRRAAVGPIGAVEGGVGGGTWGAQVAAATALWEAEAELQRCLYRRRRGAASSPGSMDAAPPPRS